MVDSEEIMKKDREFIVQSYAKKPIVVSEGDGIVIRGLDGKEYIDWFSGISVVNIGHAPEKVVKAGIEQLKKLLHCSGLYYSIPQTLLAEKLAHITPKSLNKSFFCNSGAEAVEGAIKLSKKYSVARQRTGAGLIALECSFHGRLGLSLTLTGQSKYKHGFGTFAIYPGVVHAPTPYCYRCHLKYPDCDLECARKVEDIIKFHTSGDVAAMIVEPIQGEGGIIVPPEGYLKKVQQICQKHNTTFIADEVQTGFGRCGTMFACDIWDIDPDIMTLAKGLGGGLPIGAVICKDEISDCIVSGDHFSTFGGNPVSCAVALENINYLLDEGLVDNSKKIGQYIMNVLSDLSENNTSIGEVRGKGLMIGVELVKDGDSKIPAVEETQQIAESLMKKGVLIGTGGINKNVLRIQPPLCLTEEQASKVLDLLTLEIKNI
jgi:4-aminobutyrate aminotransferase